MLSLFIWECSKIQRAPLLERSLNTFYGWILVVFLSGCVAVTSPQAEPPATLSPDLAATAELPSPSPSPSVVIRKVYSPTPTISPTFTLSPSPTLTVKSPSLTITPTISQTPLPVYTKLRGKVIIAQAVCHYGPGAPYLYKYGVYAGSNLEILRRVKGGNYIEVQAIGGNNPCWVRADYMEIRGDFNSLLPVHPFEVKLPISPYYTPPAWVRAERNGDEVTVEWDALSLRAGDDSEQTPYIVEAWVCQGGQMVFQPIGSYLTRVKVRDEAGCAEVSRARLIAAEKHGYTRPLEIEWPQPVSASPIP